MKGQMKRVMSMLIERLADYDFKKKNMIILYD